MRSDNREGCWARADLLENERKALKEGALCSTVFDAAKAASTPFSQQFAEQVFGQIRGFGEYGFPESHAASFALLVYVSAWLKCHHPAAFTAALLGSQPMAATVSASSETQSGTCRRRSG